MNRRIYFLFLLTFAFACQDKPTPTNQSRATELPDSTGYVINSEHEVDGLKIYPLSASPVYLGSNLILMKPAAGSKHASGSEINFEFRLTGEAFELGDQTEDAEAKQLANHAEGQYFQVIFNERDPEVFHETSFSKKFEDGQYVALAHLSRSYHESVKSASAFQLFQFTVGDVTLKPEKLSDPRLFYNRPLGTYSGEDAKKVLLDFYLMNTNLTVSGQKVLVTVNDKTEFVIAKWRSYILEGLPMGVNKIKIELLDKQGKLVGGGYNRIEKTFTLQETAPIQ
ncbi:MAG: phosphopeptide-binding protein [Flammeovirgaceae bacterium]